MKICNFMPQNIQKSNNRPQIGFGNRYDKLIDTIITARPKQVALSGDDIITILTREGFEVSTNNNGRIIGKQQGQPTFIAQSPNGKKKTIDPKAIARLKEYFERKKATGLGAKSN